MEKTDKEIEIAAEEMVARFGLRASMEAAQWSNNAMERGDQKNYEFWQRVSFKITAKDRAKQKLS